ncbi:hypothetical protein [Falsiroseomonas sp. E2-1-a4]|uniref:hypothetical protein n=1 Tax=Falsiroseomonas sp. E2-1-a4 TaxID=3239299 RepID=UPI003F3D392C
MLVSLSGAVRAQPFVAFGNATADCGAVVAAIAGERAEWARQGQTQQANQIYTRAYAGIFGVVTGVMTGANWQSTTPIFGPMNILSRMLFIEQHCTRNPLDTLMSAIYALEAAEKQR